MWLPSSLAELLENELLDIVNEALVEEPEPERPVSIEIAPPSLPSPTSEVLFSKTQLSIVTSEWRPIAIAPPCAIPLGLPAVFPLKQELETFNTDLPEIKIAPPWPPWLFEKLVFETVTTVEKSVPFMILIPPPSDVAPL